MITTCYSSNRPDKLGWVKELAGVDYVFIRGNPDLDREYLYDPDSHSCILRCSDTYVGLPEKIRAGFRFVYETFDPDYVVKVDDDVIVDVPKLMAFLESNTSDYAGNITYQYDYALCSGPIYCISRHALYHMQHVNISGINKEDVCIGRHANTWGIPLYHYELYTNDHALRNNYIAYHDADRIEFQDPPKVIQSPEPTPTRTTSFRLPFLRNRR